MCLSLKGAAKTSFQPSQVTRKITILREKNFLKHLLKFLKRKLKTIAIKGLQSVKAAEFCTCLSWNAIRTRHKTVRRI